VIGAPPDNESAAYQLSVMRMDASAPRRSSATSSSRPAERRDDAAARRVADRAGRGGVRVALAAGQQDGGRLADLPVAGLERDRSLQHRAPHDGGSEEAVPGRVDYSIVYDPTIFVRDSIKAVVETLLEAVLLVVIVVVVSCNVAGVGDSAAGVPCRSSARSRSCWRSLLDQRALALRLVLAIASWSMTRLSLSKTSSATSSWAWRRASDVQGDG